MPDSNGRFRGISVPRLPWLEDDKPEPDLMAALRASLDATIERHNNCGTPQCCGGCQSATI